MSTTISERPVLPETSTTNSSSLQVPSEDPARSTSIVSTASSTDSTKSTLSRIASRFRFPDVRTERKRNDEGLRENMMTQLELHAKYENEGREKMGGGAAGARGLGH
jgi:hypothetical protein